MPPSPSNSMRWKRSRFAANACDHVGERVDGPAVDALDAERQGHRHLRVDRVAQDAGEHDHLAIGLLRPLRLAEQLVPDEVAVGALRPAAAERLQQLRLEPHEDEAGVDDVVRRDAVAVPVAVVAGDAPRGSHERLLPAVAPDDEAHAARPPAACRSRARRSRARRRRRIGAVVRDRAAPRRRGARRPAAGRRPPSRRGPRGPPRRRSCRRAAPARGDRPGRGAASSRGPSRGSRRSGRPRGSRGSGGRSGRG